MKRIFMRAGIALLLVMLTCILIPHMLLCEALCWVGENLEAYWEALDSWLSDEEKK